jgi:hypothetical protein
LLDVNITAAQSIIAGGTLANLSGENRPRRGLAVQANFTYVASSATTVDAYVQTSLDGGATWIDIIEFHFTTASARKVANVNAGTSVTSEATPTDGSLGAGDVVDGILGDQLRVKWVSVGTYGAGTSLVITAVPN